MKDTKQKSLLDLGGKNKIIVGVGWDHKKSDGPSHDLDTSVLLLSSDGQCHEMQDLCCYKEGHRTVHGGALIHYGDETVGAKSGDDEKIDINLSLVPSHIEKMLVVVSIHHASARNQNFGQVNGAYVRIMSDDGQSEVFCKGVAVCLCARPIEEIVSAPIDIMMPEFRSDADLDQTEDACDAVLASAERDDHVVVFCRIYFGWFKVGEILTGPVCDESEGRLIHLFSLLQS